MSIVKQGLRQQQKSLSERITNLEESLARVLYGVNQRFQAIDQRLALLEETAAALTQIQGPDDVASFITAERTERAKTQMEQEQTSLEASLRDGYVAKAEVVGERSLIVGQYKKADGTVVEPGRAQLAMPGVAEQFKAQLLGKGAGTVLELPENNTFELLEIYTVDEEKARALVENKATTETSVATAAATAVASADEATDSHPSAGQ